MRVSIVGATGVLGRGLIPMLVPHHHVRVLARNPERAANLFGADVEIIQCDLLDGQIAQRLPTLLLGSEAVLHLATAIPSAANAPGAWDANTKLRTVGTRRLLDAALAVGAAYYLQQSIVMAYPDRGDEWIDESIPLDPDSTIVLNMESMVQALPESKIRWCILRGGTFVGKGTFEDGRIERLKAGTESVPCDGHAFMPYVHVEDVARAVVAALESRAAGIYNIVDEPVRQGEYLDRLAAVVGAVKPPRDPNMPCPPSWRCSSAAARRALGWSPTKGIYPTH
jgi:nucleoside-diphosphate-sugar epimerase